jgi:hypothetical protein
MTRRCIAAALMLTYRRNRSGAGASRREDIGRSAAATIDRSETREATPGAHGPVTQAASTCTRIGETDHLRNDWRLGRLRRRRLRRREDRRHSLQV